MQNNEHLYRKVTPKHPNAAYLTTLFGIVLLARIARPS
jgi:hypothetical protein